MFFAVLTGLAAVVGGYIIGSIPTGYLVVRAVKSIDIRTIGSGNIGATNVKRAAGTGWFFFVLVFDALKGFVPVLVLRLIYGDIYPLIPVLAGGAAIAGHTFTVFLKFKGGKGVATGLGVFLALAPYSTGSSLFVFMILVALFKYVSLGSIVGAALLPAFIFVYAEGVYALLLAVAAAVFIIYKHKENIKRLVSGTENRFEFGG